METRNNMCAAIWKTTRWHHTSFLPIYLAKPAFLENEFLVFFLSHDIFTTFIEHLSVSLLIGETIST